MAIINTKLFSPRIRGVPITRADLHQQLDLGLQQPLTLVCAPAGYGKSCLLSNWAKVCEHTHTWLQLEPADSNPQRLLLYLTAAIRKAEPNALANTWGFLQAGGHTNIDDVCLSFINEACDLTQDLAIIVDDYHSLESSACDELITQLIEYTPPQLHWYIATREDPSLPLAKWRAQGTVNELRAADLTFTPNEATAFFNQHMQLPLPAATVNTLCQRTEGWVAALQLAALSLKNQPDVDLKVAAFTGSNRFVTDYLMSEVLATLSDELKTFIASTAHLPRFNASLCDAVTEANNAAACLHSLEHNNVFLVALDDQREWYRYHHLFADVVVSQHGQLGLEKSRVLARASVWFDKNQLALDAIESARASHDPTLQAQMIEKHWPRLRHHHSETEFLAWMADIPKSFIQQQPVLCAHYGLALLSEQFELGQEYLHWAEQPPGQTVVYNHTAHASVAGIVNIAKAYIAGAQGDYSATITNTEQAIAQLPATDHVWHGAAAALRGIQYWCTGDFPQAIGTLKQACKHMLASNDNSAHISTRFLLASALTTHGRLNEARRELDTALGLLQQLNGIYPQGSADLMILRAECDLEANNIAQAQQWIDQAENLGGAAQLVESRHHLPIMRAQLALATGNYNTALAELTIAEELKSHSPTPEFVNVDTLRALFAIHSNHLADATDWVNAQLTAFKDSSLPDISLPNITLDNAIGFWVVGLYAVRHCEAFHLAPSQLPPSLNLDMVEQILEALESWAKNTDCQGFTINVLLLQTELALAKQQKRSALAHFEQALTLAQNQGYLRKLLHCTATAKLLPDISKSSYPQLYPQLQQALTVATKTEHTALVEPLSERELQVLTQLDTSLTGPEIADKLFVSLNTFRTHSKNIYTKLGVNSRRSAVARAQALGLVDS